MDVEGMIISIEEMLKSDDKTVLMDLVERGGDPFLVLIGTILSHRTREERTAEALKRLFGRFKGVEDLAEANPDEVMELIRSVGFYRSKSKRIVELAKIIRDKFNGVVPNTMEELLSLPSVGRKTANCVLVYGYGLDAIPVDTHVHRIANRIGIVNTRTPEETELRLRELVPKRSWKLLNDLFVRFGRSICKPVRPKCDTCLINRECEYYKKERKNEL